MRIPMGGIGLLLLNKTLLRMSKGLWGWILLIAGLKMAVLAFTAGFAQVISGFLGGLASPSMDMESAKGAVLSALGLAAVLFAAEMLTGEAEYRCTAGARESLRRRIFSKALELDVGNIEKIGPVSAITASAGFRRSGFAMPSCSILIRPYRLLGL